MLIKSKATVTKIKLPQLTPSYIRERSTRHSHARSVNPSPSPISKILQPTTPMHSTHHKNSYYHYTSIMKIDSTPASEVEMFNCLYKPVEEGTNKKIKESPLKRIRNSSNENFINNFIASRDPRRSAPNLDMYPNYFQKPQQFNETKRIEIRNKIMEIYRQVEKLLANHKGYARQTEKKQVVITLVKLRREFLLLNQDFNDYYVLPQAEPDQEFKNRMDMLIKLFQPNKLQKSNRVSVFGFDESFTSDNSQLMQFLSDQISDQEQNYSTSQQSNDNLSEVSGQISQSKRNAQLQRSKQSVQRQSKIFNTIEQVQIQQITQQVDQTKQKRKSIKNEIKETKCTIPKKYTKLNIENINDKQDNQIIKYSDEEPQQSESGTGEKGTDTIRRYRNDAKVISRKNAIFGGDQRELINKREFRINTEGQMVSVSDNEKSSENRRQSEETNRNGLEYREDLLSNQEQIDEILNQVENELIGYQRIDLNDKSRPRNQGIEFNNQNTIKGTNIQQNKNQGTQNKKQQQQSQYEIPPEFQNQIIDENGLIEALYNCEYIYDPRILDHYRIEKQYTSWDDDIDFIYCNEYQFR